MMVAPTSSDGEAMSRLTSTVLAWEGGAAATSRTGLASSGHAATSTAATAVRASSAGASHLFTLAATSTLLMIVYHEISCAPAFMGASPVHLAGFPGAPEFPAGERAHHSPASGPAAILDHG